MSQTKRASCWQSAAPLTPPHLDREVERALPRLFPARVSMPEGLRRRIPASCPLCTSRCGCEAIVESDRLVALEPDPSHPTGKALCAKGRASPELVEAPDRLLFPLRRTRPKGDPDRKGLGLIDRSRIIRHREHAVEPALGPAVF